MSVAFWQLAAVTMIVTIPESIMTVQDTLAPEAMLLFVSVFMPRAMLLPIDSSAGLEVARISVSKRRKGGPGTKMAADESRGALSSARAILPSGAHRWTP